MTEKANCQDVLNICHFAGVVIVNAPVTCPGIV